MIELRPPDLENLAGQETGREHLSNSSIGTQLACLRRFGWRYVEDLELIAKPRPLGMGSAFHKAIELRDPVAGAALLDRPTFDQADRDRVLMDKAIVTGAATLYLATWGDRSTRVPPESETDSLAGSSQREVEYLIRLRNPETGHYSRTFDLKGMADGVIDNGTYLELIEDKFVGRVDAAAAKRVALDRQVGLEAYALWRITGKPVRKIHYRFTKKPSIKQKQNETVDDFCARVIQDYQDRPEFYVHAETTFRTDEDLLLIERELWDLAEQRRDAIARGFFVRNTGACGDYGGCQFIDLCSGDPDAMSLYRKRETA